MQMQVDFSFMLEKAKYWEHVDGSLWWRNPQTQQIEPYQSSPDSVTQAPENVTKPIRIDTTHSLSVPVLATTWYDGDEKYFSEFSTSRLNFHDMTDGCNGTILVNFENCSGVHKPIDYEYKGVLRKNLDMKVPQAMREVLSYGVSKLCGLNVVPPTTLRVQTVSKTYNRNRREYAKGKARLGSLQLFIKGKKRNKIEYEDGTYFDFQENASGALKQEFMKLQVLDIITGNTDRHYDNYMIDMENDRVYAIDNGLTFPVDNKEKRTDPFISKLTFNTVTDKDGNDREYGLYRPITEKDASLIDRGTRNRVLSVTQEQFMSLFNEITFSQGEDKLAYQRLVDLQKVFKTVNDLEDSAIEHHMETSVSNEVARLKQDAADEAAGELFPERTAIREANIDNMRSNIKRKLFPNRKVN